MFEALDFLYIPSRDVASDTRYFHEVLGAEVVFAVDGMGARVAALRMAEGPPLFLLADHLDGERPILVYRVADLEATVAELESRGWEPEGTFEIPPGPCCSFATPAGHRLAVYELTRPEVVAHFEGRRDF
ncbi:MAG: VOC family protein [Actinomycetota bacterium]